MTNYYWLFFELIKASLGSYVLLKKTVYSPKIFVVMIEVFVIVSAINLKILLVPSPLILTDFDSPILRDATF